jgi:hypothetical protein
MESGEVGCKVVVGPAVREKWPFQGIRRGTPEHVAVVAWRIATPTLRRLSRAITQQWGFLDPDSPRRDFPKLIDE